MLKLTSILQADSYKMQHRKMYSPNTEVVYSTWTPRKSRMRGVDKVVVFGLQYFIKDYLIDCFNETFFNRPKEEVISEFKRVMKAYSGDDDASHWEALHDLGYLPLRIDALEEGTLCPIRVPMFTIQNTLPEFYWLTNFIETIMSTEIWKPMTSATIALEYRKICEKWAEKTCDNTDHLDFQGHDFSMRGMAGLDSACSSGAGHLLSFKGTDTIPAVLWLEKYYEADSSKELVGCSIPATEHSVAETNIIEIQDILNSDEPYPSEIKAVQDEYMSEIEGFDARKLAELHYMNRLLSVYPSGIFSYVADTYNLWEVLTSILPVLKDKIMARDGKVVIRPDSGDPCDIICGLNSKIANDEACERHTYQTSYKITPIDNKFDFDRDNVDIENPRYSIMNWDYIKNEEGITGEKLTRIEYIEEQGELHTHMLKSLIVEGNQEYAEQRYKGVIELLWDVFGGTVNSKGYKVLDPHIGCIYGDAITLERAEEICRRLESKGFASSNIVFGVGSYTYNMNTRDTFGFALKTTYGKVNGKELLLYKDPITDDGTKKSQKGMVVVLEGSDGELTYVDELDSTLSASGNLLKPVFKNGVLLREYSLSDVRNKLQKSRNVKTSVSV